MVKAYTRKRPSSEWHGTWRPLEIVHYDPISALLGPETEMVGVEMRCGKTFSSKPSGLRAADRHEADCSICQQYKEAKR